MTIAKLRKPFIIDLFWLPYDDFLWKSTVTISELYTPPSEYVTLGYPLDNYNTTELTTLGSVYVDNILYTETNSIAACIALEKSWFFNVSTQELYLHVDHRKRMSASEFDILEVKGYSTSGSRIFEDSNDNSYKPVLLSTFELSDEVDRGVFEKMSFVSNQLEFANQIQADGTGEFDYTRNPDEIVPGADIDILFISEDNLESGSKSLTKLYTGWAESDSFTADQYAVSMADKREQLNAKFPNTFFDSTTYPLMSDDLDELIPEGYGTLKGVPAFCTNDTVTSGAVEYKYATDGTTLTTVYVKIDGSWSTVTPSVSSATNCTFTLLAVDGRSSSGAPYEAKVDCRLRDIDEPHLILSDMITRYLGFPFTADYFDFSVWSDEGSLLGDINLLMQDRREFFEWGQLLQNSSTIPFIFRLNPDGKYWIRVDDITRQIRHTFQRLDNVNDDRPIETDFTQYATDVEILYNRDWESGRFKRITDDQFKDETLDTYRLEKELSFETLLVSQADAEERAENALKEYKKARPLHTVSIRGIIPISLLDVIVYDSSICLSESCTRNYAGTNKIKIASYNYDFENEITNLTGYEINDIVSKGTEIYSQGTANGLFRANGFTNVNSTTTTYQPEAG